ncbi:MAG: polymerase sigma factor, sigma-70 family [Planctomycetota bacterium]|nr:polymerase sigma factor, sigma-70 family [Planctomycetota bacterium]
MDDVEFGKLLAAARSGDDEATATLLRAFEADVRMMVRARLPAILRSGFDSLDFVQAVWQSVFAGAGLAEEFANAGHFRGYLAGVARNKVFEEFRRRTRTRKFDVGREEPLYLRRGHREAPRDLPAPGPTPSQVVAADECLARIVAGRPPLEARVIDLRRLGLTFDEIAASTGLHERAVRRVIEAARKRMAAE